MLPTRQGSIRLFRFAGIQVYLHWSWFVIAMYEVNRSKQYGSFFWNVLEYLTLFGIVLMHEFGHALACRQVGGKAEQIVLWPLGGVAYVAPPQRPGATLWSIAAGPLVNVILAPIFTGLFFLAMNAGLAETHPDFYQYVQAVCFMNFALIIFNLLPIYPLDGGQIARSLLWFVCGRARSLLISSMIGFVGVAGLVAMAILGKSLWTGVISVFILLNCWRGLMHARWLSRIAKLPRRAGFQCPACHQPPVLGAVWRCARCFKPFDTFATLGICPHCSARFETTACFDCGESHPLGQWTIAPPMARENPGM